MKKKIVFYTQVYYLDAALEYIQLASQLYDLYVFIELTPHASKANIFDLDVDLTEYGLLIPISDIAEHWKISYIIPYLNDCVSASFVNHPTNKSLSFDSVRRAFNLASLLEKIKPDYVHLDDFSLRQVGLLPWFVLRRNSVILNVHDPKPHSGEGDVKKKIFATILYKLVGRYLCMSDYSAAILRGIVTTSKKVFTIKLLPYTVYQHFKKNQDTPLGRSVTFVGRLSPYKGINLFVEAYKRLYEKQGCNYDFVIAGKAVSGYDLSNILPEQYEHLVVKDKHLSNEEIVEIVQNSAVIVCPYLDATQSGVLMMAFALKKPVIVTPVGGLPEYVKNKNGIVAASTTADALENAIIEFFDNPTISKDNWDASYWNDIKVRNLDTIRQLYV